MRNYRFGDDEIDRQIDELLAAADDHPDDHVHHDDLVREMIVTSLKLLRDDSDRGDLKLINTALKEMRYSFLVFSRHRDVPKVTVYGSARTTPEDPNYSLASEFSNRMVDDHRWMVVTGAGPGIMEASNRGAGADYSFGVNIRLPFEAEANPYVHESKLINFKYFFTRKLIFVKESHAFVLFPGGFGTQDESFELLTLIQTGKSDLHPVVMLEAPGTGYWEPWRAFVDNLATQGMISPDDFSLFRITDDIDVAIDEILTFYRIYHSQRYVDGNLVLRLRAAPSPELVERLNDEFADIVSSGRIEATAAFPAERDDHPALPRLALHFDRRHHGRLRQLIDVLNREVESA